MYSNSVSGICSVFRVSKIVTKVGPIKLSCFVHLHQVKFDPKTKGPWPKDCPLNTPLIEVEKQAQLSSYSLSGTTEYFTTEYAIVRGWASVAFGLGRNNCD